MKICDIQEGWELHADICGHPYLLHDGRAFEVATHNIMAYPGLAAVEAWQADPENDCLRARGDPRYTAASSAAMIWKQRKIQDQEFLAYS